MGDSSCVLESDHESGYVEKDGLLTIDEPPTKDGPLASDGLFADDSTPFRLLDLPIEIQSRVVDFLEFRDLTYLRATCRTMRTLPTESQRRQALLEYERDSEKFWFLWRDRQSNRAMRLHVDGNEEWRHWAYFQTSFPRLFGPEPEPNQDVARWTAEFDQMGLSTFRTSWEFPSSSSSSRRPLADYLPCYMCLSLQWDGRFDSSMHRRYGWSWNDSPNFDPTDAICDEEKLRYPEDGCRCFIWYDSDGEDESGKRLDHDDEAICRRLFKSDLCKDCFTEENKDWFAFKQRLRDEISAMGSYLRYMEQVDESTKDLKSPSTEDLPRLDFAFRE
ncbi:hypothetical protein EDD36DRAFT_479402 [Exophiala viscosa]|uniref:F-box domain-containing protein n=1 Tax=Exophiala viscosa TaxID=2486360 RepID=A0AAN6E3H9_9EURO|nr:hypothetical protein EDD36DRAFT_479402 [Exophiala viscosa]